jgi:hypothetical protein
MEMKKINKFLLMTVISLSALFVNAKVFAADSLDIQSQEMVCEPEAIEAGGKADCYIIGRENGDSHASHGVVVQYYTTDKLKVTGAMVNNNLKSSAGAIVKKPTDPTTGNGTNLDAVEGVKNFVCKGEDLGILPSGGAGVNDSGCVIFYSAGTDATVKRFTKDTLAKPRNVSEYLSDAMGDDRNLVVLGNLVVELAADNKNEDCGEICWATWSIPSPDYYAKYRTCAESGTSSSECGEEHVNGSDTACKKLKMLMAGEPENVITGSFVSYTILAAGILLAISAVAIAKKNNRLQKI